MLIGIRGVLKYMPIIITLWHSNIVLDVAIMLCVATSLVDNGMKPLTSIEVIQKVTGGLSAVCLATVNM